MIDRKIQVIAQTDKWNSYGSYARATRFKRVNIGEHDPLNVERPVYAHRARRMEVSLVTYINRVFPAQTARVSVEEGGGGI